MKIPVNIMNVGSPFHKTRDLLNIREEIIVRNYMNIRNVERHLSRVYTLLNDPLVVLGRNSSNVSTVGNVEGNFMKVRNVEKIMLSELFFIREFIPVRNYVNECCGIKAFRYNFQLSLYQRIYAD